MTMHLAHPSLSLAGKKKGKQKFRNADEARKARELEASDRKSTRLNSSHSQQSRMPSSA